MKKNVLLILLSAALLSSCDLNFNLFGKKTDSAQKEENNEKNQENPGKNEDSTGGDTNTGGDESKPEIHDEYTATISLSDSGFSSITSGKSGHQFDDEAYSAHTESLKNYFESNLSYENLLTRLVCTNNNTAILYSKLYFCLGTGYHANGNFKEGILKWTSGVKIYKVEISALAYAKEYNNTVNPDTISHVWIDSDDHSLETTEAPEKSTFIKEYNEGVNSFTLKSTGSRVLLESIKITWGA